MNTHNYRVCFINGNTLKYQVYECVAADRKATIDKAFKKFGENLNHAIIDAYAY